MSFNYKRVLLIAGILGLAIVIAGLLVWRKSPPPSEPVGEVEILLEVQTLEAGDYEFKIRSQGTVRPLTETQLSAEVSGSIVSVSPKFVAGGVFAAGEELMRIDPTNYVGAAAQAEALVKQRQIEYDGAKSLRTQGYRAEAEYASAAAALATAEAELTRAKRDLDRTRIRLPYDGMVRSRGADIGQFVNPGQEIGVVFATDYAEVRLPLTDQDLAFIDLPDASEVTSSGVSSSGPRVELSAIQRGVRAFWQARIVRSEGVVDERARVTYAVARIRDPYHLHGDSGEQSPLPMGTFVSAEIDGAAVQGVVRLPREAIRRSNEVVFVSDDNRLAIESVNIINTDAEYAYVSGDTAAGKRISLTAIESPFNGMKVRTTDDPKPEAAEDERVAVKDTLE